MSETEIKFVLREDPLPTLKKKVFPALTKHSVTVEDKGQIELLNDYYDTEDHFFQQHKIGMRVRGENGRYEQTVKTQGQISGGLHRRQEYNVDLNDDSPDLSLFNDVNWPKGTNAQELNDKLEKQFGTHFTRSVFNVIYDDAKVELVFDKGSVVAPPNEAPICEIELELKEGELGRLFDLAGELAVSLPVRLSDTSKAAQGYQLLHGVSTKVQPLPDFLPLDDTVTTEVAFCRAMECGLQHWQVHEHRYFETGATKMLTEIARAVQMLLQTVSLYLPVLQCPELLRLHKHLLAYADNWLWQDDLQSLRLLLSKKSLFNKKLSRYPALLSYLQGRQAGLVQAHDPATRLFQSQPSVLKLDSARLLQEKPWRSSAQDYDLALMAHAKGWLSQGWQTIQQTMPIQRRMYASNYTSVEMLLRQTLFNGFLLADLFEDSRGHFRAPWLDILTGIDELNALLLLKKSIFDAELAEQQELLEWVHEKTHSLLAVMERSRQVALSGEIYW
ncbi:MAG: CYTH domain-containing protein [Alteromonadaceae bacterium]|nr:CYTH domain-containing protein [Alteromonadaceae bacterium]